MNKKLKYGLGLAAAIALVACSADSISNADIENWPSDFNVVEYGQVNPDLATYQALTAVADSNAILRQQITQKMVDSIVAADLSDKTDEEKLTSAQDKAEKNVKKRFVTGTILNEDAEWAAYFDDAAAVKEIFLSFAALPESYWPGEDAFRNGMYNPDSSINIMGQTAMQYRLALNPYHIYGNTASKDLAFLKSVPVREDLIKYQYVRAGKYEGRPYRYCKAEDNAVVKQLTIEVTPYDTTITVRDTLETTKIDTSATGTKYALVSGDTVPHEAYMKKLAMGDTIAIIDTILQIDTIVVKEVVKRDTLVTWKKTKMTAGSPNAIPVGSSGDVWDFSADFYCRKQEDGEVYLIANP